MPTYALAALDCDHDGHPDLVLGGNATQSRIGFGNNDASQGRLRGDGRNGRRACACWAMFAALPK